MNPRVPGLLSEIIGVAERTLDRPTGETRRQAIIEKLFDEVSVARDWATDQPRRLVNDWTLMLMTMVRKIERLGPLGDAGELVRAATVGIALLPYVRADLAAALEVLRDAGRDRSNR